MLTASGSSASVAPNARCGTGLVAGVSGCIEWMMKLSEYRDLIARAQKGDNVAAVKLAQFEDSRDDRRVEGGRKWWLLAAERGDCQALRTMRDAEKEAGRTAAADKWQARIRSHRCQSLVTGERWLGDY
jgi:hypothetical protein